VRLSLTSFMTSFRYAFAGEMYNSFIAFFNCLGKTAGLSRSIRVEVGSSASKEKVRRDFQILSTLD
jgi:hypothetical protein